MSKFQEKLAGIKAKNRAAFTAILREHVGEIAIITYDRNAWAAFIGCAILSGISIRSIAEAVDCEPEKVRNWLDGSLVDSRTKEQQRAVEYIAKRLLSPDED